MAMDYALHKDSKGGAQPFFYCQNSPHENLCRGFDNRRGLLTYSDPKQGIRSIAGSKITDSKPLHFLAEKPVDPFLTSL